MSRTLHFPAKLAFAFVLLGIHPTRGATEQFFSPSQTATQVSSTMTATTIRSGGYEFTYSVDGYWSAYPGGPPTGRFFSVSWPDGIQAQAITAGPTVGAGANMTIRCIDGKPFDLLAFTGKLLANTAGAGGAFEVMPKLNGEDAFNDPRQYFATGYAGQSFPHTPNLSGYESYKIHLWVDFALTALTLRHTSMATLSTSSVPAAGGSAAGGGSYEVGSAVTVTATANPGYVFVNWTDGAATVGNQEVFDFTLEGDRTLVAHFTPGHRVGATISPEAGGSVAGTGGYAAGTSVSLSAIPAAGYSFQGWRLNGSPVSTSPTHTFTPTSDVVLDAAFGLIIPGMITEQSSSGILLIKWPDSLPGWELEESDDLQAGSWIQSVATIESAGGYWRASVPTSPGRRFFRLVHQ